MTHRVALIGNPLKRRHSAVMHNAAFAAHGIDAVYELKPVEPEDLASFFAEAREPDWLGFGVTAPYKEAAMEYLDEVEPGAAAIGAVNNGLRRLDGSLVGFNTDAPGFISAVRAAGVNPAGRTAVVVGAGGAARAVVWALADAGARSVFVVNRSPDRAVALAEDMSAFGVVDGGSFHDLPELAAGADIAVNATTMGMTTDDTAFDVTLLPDHSLVFDLVYVPAETPLIRTARDRGLTVSNGMEMLIRQGEIAFDRWTGIGSTATIMRKALDEESADSEPEG